MAPTLPCSGSCELHRLRWDRLMLSQALCYPRPLSSKVSAKLPSEVPVPWQLQTQDLSLTPVQSARADLRRCSSLLTDLRRQTLSERSWPLRTGSLTMARRHEKAASRMAFQITSSCEMPGWHAGKRARAQDGQVQPGKPFGAVRVADLPFWPT